MALLSEQGERVVLESPWAGGGAPAVAEAPAGNAVAVGAVAGGFWTFATVRGGRYVIRSRAGVER